MKKIRVTPEMANAWLDVQAKNRKPSNNTIQKYALAMSQGIWIADQRMPISFDEDGKLVDGQHRLFAVIEHGAPVEFYTTTIARSVLDLMHETRPRSLADRMVIGRSYDQSDARAIAALGTIIATRMQYGRLSITTNRVGVSSRSYRPDEIYAAFDWCSMDPVVLTKEARHLYHLQPTKFRLISASLIGYLLAQGAGGVNAFIQQIVMDEHPNRCSSAVALRRQLGNTNYLPSHRLALTAKAFNSQDAKLIRIGDEVEDLNGGNFRLL